MRYRSRLSTAILTPHLNSPCFKRISYFAGRTHKNAVVDSKYPDSELWKRGQEEWKIQQIALLKQNPSNAVLSIIFEK